MVLDNSNNLYVVKPKRRQDIEEKAMIIRKFLSINDKALFVNVIEILELKLCTLFNDDITYSILEKWNREEEAYYDIKKNVIFIRSDVYNKAVCGDGRARFTIMHEIAHYILFKLWGFPYQLSLKKIVDISDATLKSMDPEWQANTFAGAFLCKNDLVKFMGKEEIEIKCGVSTQAAYVAYCNSHGLYYKESCNNKLIQKHKILVI